MLQAHKKPPSPCTPARLVVAVLKTGPLVGPELHLEHDQLCFSLVS